RRETPAPTRRAVGVASAHRSPLAVFRAIVFEPVENRVQLRDAETADDIAKFRRVGVAPQRLAFLPRRGNLLLEKLAQGRASGGARKIQPREKIHAKFAQAARRLRPPRVKGALSLRGKFHHFARGATVLGDDDGFDPAALFIFLEDGVHLAHAEMPHGTELLGHLFVQVIAMQRTVAQKAEQRGFGRNVGFHENQKSDVGTGTLYSIIEYSTSEESGRRKKTRDRNPAFCFIGPATNLCASAGPRMRRDRELPRRLRRPAHSQWAVPGAGQGARRVPPLAARCTDSADSHTRRCLRCEVYNPRPHCLRPCIST